MLVEWCIILKSRNSEGWQMYGIKQQGWSSPYAHQLLLTSSFIANQMLLASYGVNYEGSQEVSFSCFASSVYVDFLFALDTCKAAWQRDFFVF